MKVFVKTGNKVNGPTIFLDRLCKSFQKHGISVEYNFNKDFDLALFPGIIDLNTQKKTVMRLDGAYFNSAWDYQKINQPYIESIKKADGVIYQSIFSKEICDRFLGKCECNNEIIYNGASSDFFNKLEVAKSNFKYNFITCSSWRPHKRLRDAIESFLLSDINNSCLFVAGEFDNLCLLEEEVKKYKEKGNVIFLGNLDQKRLGSYFKLCNASIHLCWLDCCPNSVIEALCAGCPVITNNVGGTREIISKGGGIICNIDGEFNLNPIDLYNPPKIDRSEVANAIIRTTTEKIIVKKDAFSIYKTAEKYLNFFKVIL